MMTKIQRYIGKHVLIATIAIWLGLMLLINLFTLLAEFGSLRMNYQYPQAISHVLMTTPGLLIKILPVSCLVGAIVGLGMLVNHNELMIIRISGTSRFNICWAVIKPLLVLIVTGMLLSEFVVPNLQYEAEIKRNAARLRDHNQVKNGVWWRHYDDYIHINKITNDRIDGIQIFSFDDAHQLKRTTYAEYAIKDNRKWVLNNVSSVTCLPDEMKKQTTPTETWDLRLNTRLLKMAMTVPEYLSIRDLLTYIHYMKTQYSRIHNYQLSLYDKIFYPFTIISLLLIAISFVFGPLRSATAGDRLFTGIIISTLFMLLQKLSGPASTVFGFSPLLAVLLPVFVVFIISLFLLRRIN